MVWKLTFSGMFMSTWTLVRQIQLHVGGCLVGCCICSPAFQSACSLHHEGNLLIAAESTSEMSINLYQSIECNSQEQRHPSSYSFWWYNKLRVFIQSCDFFFVKSWMTFTFHLPNFKTRVTLETILYQMTTETFLFPEDVHSQHVHWVCSKKNDEILELC